MKILQVCRVSPATPDIPTRGVNTPSIQNCALLSTSPSECSSLEFIPVLTTNIIYSFLPLEFSSRRIQWKLFIQEVCDKFYIIVLLQRWMKFYMKSDNKKNIYEFRMVCTCKECLPLRPIYPKTIVTLKCFLSRTNSLCDFFYVC